MSKLVIFCDSCSSITKEDALRLDVKVIPMNFEMEGVEINPLSDDVIDIEEFYNKLEDKVYCKTSCVNPGTYMELFKPYLEEGKDILFISLSSGLSSSFNNAVVAKNALSEEYENKVEIIDSLTGSLGIQFAINEAVKMRDEGKGIEEITEKIQNNGLNIDSLFTIGSLDHLRRGGRLSRVSSLLGTLLHINPIITASKEGRLVEDSKHRGRKKAINELIKRVIENAKAKSKVLIGYTNCKDEANYMKECIEKEDFDVSIGYIDHTMGCHCGPKTLAVFYMKKATN